MSSFRGGPADGKSLMLRRSPLYLRVVVARDGGVDALDQPDDVAAEDETIHVYVRSLSLGHVCVRSGKGRGCYEVGEYTHVPDVDGEQFRRFAAWREWATSDPLSVAETRSAS